MFIVCSHALAILFKYLTNGCPEGYEKYYHRYPPDFKESCVIKCPYGYERQTYICRAECHGDGMKTEPGTDNCQLSTYGRGAGFPGWTERGRYERCEAAHGAGNCEQYGFVVYPKCRRGFSSVGCCLCVPKTNCKEFGFEEPRFKLKNVCYRTEIYTDCLRKKVLKKMTNFSE